jgi:hypothetical protein
VGIEFMDYPYARFDVQLASLDYTDEVSIISSSQERVSRRLAERRKKLRWRRRSQAADRAGPPEVCLAVSLLTRLHRRLLPCPFLCSLALLRPRGCCQEHARLLAPLDAQLQREHGLAAAAAKSSGAGAQAQQVKRGAPWSRADDDHLCDLAKRFDLRWPVVFDRWSRQPARRVEELQHR